VISTTDVSWLTQGIGSLYASFSAIANTNFPRVAELSDGSETNSISLGRWSGGNLVFYVVETTVQASILALASTAIDTTIKYAAAYDTNDFSAYGNGNGGTPDVSGSVPTVSQLDIGNNSGAGQYLNGHILEVAYFDERLSNELLEEYSLTGLPQDVFYIALSRRTLKGPPKKAIYPKPTRGLFR
jgi:hypothetical protein